MEKWLKIKNEVGKPIEIFINGDIESDAYDDGFLECIGMKDTNIYPNKIKTALDEANGKDIEVHINSGGGSLFAGVAICNMLKKYNGNTTAYIDGLAASAASIVAFGCKNIIIPNNAYLMIHRAMVNTFGNVDDFKKTIEILEKLEEGIVNTYMEKAKNEVTAEQVKELMTAETWFTGADANKYFNLTTTESLNVLNFAKNVKNFKNTPEKLLNNIKNHEKNEKMLKNIKLNKEIDIALSL